MRGPTLAALMVLSACPPPADPPAPADLPAPPVNDAVDWDSRTQRRDEERAIKTALGEILPGAGGGQVILMRCEKRPCLAVIYGKAAQSGRDKVIDELVNRGYTVTPKGRAGQAGKGYKWAWVVPAATGGMGPEAKASATTRIPNAWAQAIHILRPTEGP